MALSALSADPRAAGHGDCIVGMTCRDEARLMMGDQSESRMVRRHEFYPIGVPPIVGA